MRTLCIVMVLCGSVFAGLRADLNNDGVIDNHDFAILAEEWLREGEPKKKSRIMNNTIKFPARIFAMDKITLRDAVSINTGHVNEIVNVSGSERTITSATDAGDGLIRIALSDPHTFLVGDRVLLSSTSNGRYDGEYTVVGRPSRSTFQIETEWDGSTIGTACEVNEEIVYSPLDGLPAVKCIARAGGHSRFTFVFSEMLTLYPNTGFVLRKAGYIDNDQTLNTSIAASEQWSPRLVISEKTLASEAVAACYTTGVTGRENKGFTDRWHIKMPRRMGYDVRETLESPKEWATTKENQGFETTAITFECHSTETPNADVFYLGGVVTENIKPKIIITFDGYSESTRTNAFLSMQANGFRGVLYCKLGGYAGNTDWEERVQEAYDHGWDFSNHSWDHEIMNDTKTEGDFIRDTLSAKEWAIKKGWVRGSDFISYPGAILQLKSGNGADVAEQYFKMGRGRAYRATFNNPEGPDFGVWGGGYSPIIPRDMLDITHVATHKSAYDRWTAGTKEEGEIYQLYGTTHIFEALRETSVEPSFEATKDWEYLGDCNDKYELSAVKGNLEQAVLHQGVCVVYSHSVMDDPPDIHISPNYWCEFMADVSARVAAGELEVITMTEWYNEIYGPDTAAPIL